MDTQISFSPTQIVALAAAIVTLSACFQVVFKAIEHFRKPNRDQNAKIEAHDSRIKSLEIRTNDIDNNSKRITTLEQNYSAISNKISRHDELFDKDKRRLDSIEDGNRVTSQALLALLSHAIDGNNVDPCKDAKTSLENYLINR